MPRTASDMQQRNQNGSFGWQEKFDPPSQRKLFYSYSAHGEKKTRNGLLRGFVTFPSLVCGGPKRAKAHT